ncbi:MAG TPA: glycoside hydrolase family 32 protein, partial [Urbifossiella sp.]|nr:glycoside hydrolase family 32 protein [Urbifossiella sp.]
MLRLSPIALAFVLTTLATGGRTDPPAPDVLLADFEGNSYGDWKTTGTAFGDRPAAGTLPGQMPVTGFRGKGLVNSFRGGDAPTGTLTSPEFAVERRYLSFLIGGGGYPGKTCLNLVVDGKTVRTATGPNVNPGGSEELALAFWDVADLRGKKARLVVVDDATGGWGHINVDHIVLTDTRPAVPAPAARDLTVTHRYLHFPVRTGDGRPGITRRVAVRVDGKTVREFDIELSDRPEWFAHLDVGAWKGKTVTLRVDKLPPDSKALDLVAQADTVWDAEKVYREPLRPRLHFSSRRGWLNDPNGLVYANGEYHLYYQHNPYGWHWGNMHWGHAVSRDLVHWEELPIALYPPRHGDWVFSGSAVVDKGNTSGWKTGDNDLLVAAFTSTGRGECIAYSNDRGRTWTEYAGNPVVRHAGRDPRLLWHAPTRQWVMAVYDEAEGKRWIAFHTSPDLKAWTYRSRIEGFYECPDLFELPVDGDEKARKWVLTAADSDYVIGAFDGREFKPETPRLKGSRGVGFYAAQTVSSDPKGRVVQIGWLQAPTPGTPFNQAMSLPLRLQLRRTADGPRLSWSPVEELAALRTTSHRFGPREVRPGDNPLAGIAADALEVEAVIEPQTATHVEFRLRGVAVGYDVAKQELTVQKHRVPAPLQGGKLRLRVFLDRTCAEVLAGDGLVYVPLPVIPAADDRSAALTVRGGPARVEQLDVHELGSIWDRPRP